MIRLLRFWGACLSYLIFSGWGEAKAAEMDIVALEMTRILQNEHYARMPFNEELSERFLERFLDELDGDRLYFLKAEVEGFRRLYERDLHDRISMKSAMPVARGIYELYARRVRERVAFSKALLAQGDFKFDSERVVLRDRAGVDWPEGLGGLAKLWRGSLENSLLSERIRRERLRGRAKEMGLEDPFEGEEDELSAVRSALQRVLKSVAGKGEEEVGNYFLSAVAQAYDPHSDYLSAGEMAKFRISVSHELVGVGVSLVMNDEGETVLVGIVRGGPADVEGSLKLGDRVVAISKNNNGEWLDVLYLPFNEVIHHVLGEEGQEVGLRVKRKVDGEDVVMELAIPRGVVVIKEDLAWARLFDFKVEEGADAFRLGVIKVPSFYFDFDDSGSRVSVDVERLLKRLLEEEIEGLILDLRGNPGGSLREVQRLTGMFVGRGPVVQVKAASGETRSLNSLHRKPLYDGPLVALTDRGSASASEILVGALQDYERAVVVGASSTFGKGTVQKTMDIADFMPVFSDREDAGWLKLTFQKYYRVSGSSVQLRGVVPDLVLPDAPLMNEIGEVFEVYPLPHDVIRRAKNFKLGKTDDLFLEELGKRSAARVVKEKYFQYLLEDQALAEEMAETNEMSLNLKVRMEKLHEEEKRSAQRRAEREVRFAKVEAGDADLFSVYRVNLDDLKKEVLPAFVAEDDRSDYIRMEEDALKALEKNLGWPSGVDFVLREGLVVLQDLVVLRNPPLPPVVEEEEENLLEVTGR